MSERVKIPHAYEKIKKIGRELISHGLDKEAREFIAKCLNYEFAEEPMSEEEMPALFKEWDDYQTKHNFKCPFRLVMNGKDDGVNNTIRMCFEKAGWKFRVNVRGDMVECNMDSDDYEHKDPGVWRSKVIGHCQNHIKHSLDIKVIGDKNGKFTRVEIKTPAFNFKTEDVKIAMDCIRDENRYDSFMEYLMSESVQDILAELKREHIGREGKLINEGRLKHWDCVSKIIQFKKPTHEKGEYFETDKYYNRHFLKSLMFPAVYSAFKPGDRFGECVLIIGPEGCFKSSLPKKLLPKQLQEQYCNKLSFNMKDDDMIRNMRKSIFAVWDEMIGFHKDEQKTKDILGALHDNYVKKFQETSLGYPRMNVNVLTTNKVNPLRMNHDAHRRYAPFVVFPNEEVTALGIKEGKSTSGFMDYLDEWADYHRDRLWAEMLLYYEMGEQPGFKGFREEREAAIRMACGLDDFEEQVRSIFNMFALSEKREACDFDDIFEQMPYARNRERELIVKNIHKDMGGDGVLKRGWMTKHIDEETTKRVSKPHFDLTKIGKESDASRKKDTNETDWS